MCRSHQPTPPVLRTHLSGSTLGPVQGRALLGLAEVRVVRVTAPKLLTWVERAELKWDKHNEN